MYWRNNVVIEQVSVTDRSFQYGDGCFTTIRVEQGQPVFWSLHKQRMLRAIERLKLKPIDWQLTERQLMKLAQSYQHGGIKIHLSRGEGGRGYSPDLEGDTLVTLSTFAYPSHYQALQLQGVSLALCETRLGLNPLLSGIKHNNRLEQVLIKHELEQKGYVDGVVLDLNGHVIETSMANVFWLKDGTLYTPNLSQSGVEGVMRQRVLELTEQWGIPTKTVYVPIETLFDAEEVFMTNSILGVAPVVAITDICFNIGDFSRRLQETLGQC
ncbi:aminodeoxychorismate lyase [Vibrio hippocampi]|uniref:Aminodeoxychorismate lyase n=1 Tax=Vibrio hippocampi TaxID=654686 RepID=A0ABM8ZI80_9VIBR|nr:aminodeoxychorismate lyase [Vibrio hippocampi]CAH0526532.1 Aminodeoxychorismate lyase [Vibrio hippocampi]